MGYKFGMRVLASAFLEPLMPHYLPGITDPTGDIGFDSAAGYEVTPGVA